MTALIQHLLNGLSYAGILFLVAAGLSLVFGVMGILNLAHGALYMIGAYVGWTVAVGLHGNFALAVLAGGLAAVAVGFVLERGFLRRLYKGLDEQALLTLGFVYVFTNLTQWIWGALERPAFAPRVFSRSIGIWDISYPTTRIVIIGTAAAVALLLWFLEKRTRMGAVVRAGRDDKEMLQALGVNFDRVSMGVFALGSLLAGMGGVIGAQVLGANLGLALNVLLVAVAVVVIGGLGSVGGSVLGAVIIGLTDDFGRAFLPHEFSLFTIYVVMVIILLIRPSGLVPGRG
jgi:branched-chain amino acid transport system permease protein